MEEESVQFIEGWVNSSVIPKPKKKGKGKKKKPKEPYGFYQRKHKEDGRQVTSCLM